MQLLFALAIGMTTFLISIALAGLISLITHFSNGLEQSKFAGEIDVTKLWFAIVIIIPIIENTIITIIGHFSFKSSKKIIWVSIAFCMFVFFHWFDGRSFISSLVPGAGLAFYLCYVYWRKKATSVINYFPEMLLMHSTQNSLALATLYFFNNHK